ncbi:MAG: hypothetical protein ABII23_04455 [bacterium]
MVKLSKFFGKENDEGKKTPDVKEGAPDIGSSSEADNKLLVRKPFPPAINNKEPVHALSSWIDSISPEETYDHVIRSFKKFLAMMTGQSGGVDPLLLDIIAQCIQHISHKEKSLMLCIDTTTLDNYLYSHSVNTAIIAIALAKGLQYPASALEDVGLTALLHHAGLFGILELMPKKLTLTHKQIDEFNKNTDTSRKLAEELICPQDALCQLISKLVAQSVSLNKVTHYPKNISDKQIQQYTHIIKLASLYELLTHAKPEQERLIPHIACKWLIENWQKLQEDDPFVSKLIRTLIETIGLYPIGSYVMLSTDEFARIIHVEKESPVRPQMEVLLSSNGIRVKEKRIISLKDTPLISIKEAVDETKLKMGDKKFILTLQVRRWWTGNIKK